MRRALPVVLVAALITAGCGKPSLAQQRFGTAAHTLCEEIQRKLPVPKAGALKPVFGRIRALIDANRSLPLVAKYLHDVDRLKALPDPKAVGGIAERLRNERAADLRTLGITSCIGLYAGEGGRQ